MTLAADLDPGYARAFAAAQAVGVEAFVQGTAISPGGLALAGPMAFIAP